MFSIRRSLILWLALLLLTPHTYCVDEDKTPEAAKHWIALDKRLQKLVNDYDNGRFEQVIAVSDKLLEDLQLFRERFPLYLKELSSLRAQLIAVYVAESRTFMKLLEKQDGHTKDLVVSKLLALAEAKKNSEFDSFVIDRQGLKSIGYLEETLLRQKVLEDKLREASKKLAEKQKELEAVKQETGVSAKIKELENNIALYNAAEEDLKKSLKSVQTLLSAAKKEVLRLEKDNLTLKSKLAKIVNRPQEIKRLEALVEANKQSEGLYKQLITLQDKRNSAVNAKVERLLNKDEGSLREIAKIAVKLNKGTSANEVKEALASEVWKHLYETEKEVTGKLKKEIDQFRKSNPEVSEAESGILDVADQKKSEKSQVDVLKKQIFELKEELSRERDFRAKSERREAEISKEVEEAFINMQKLQVQNRLVVEKYVTMQEKMIRFKDNLQTMAKDHFFSYGVFGKKLEGTLSYLFPTLFPSKDAEDQVVPEPKSSDKSK